MRLATIGFRNSFRRPFRTALSILGIALCVVLLLTVTAVTQKYTAVVGQSYSLYSTSIIVVSRASLLVEGIPIGGSIPQQAVDLVKNVKGVQAATPLLLVVDVQHLVPTNVTVGVPIGNFSMFAKTNSIVLRGSYPTSPTEVTVGSNLADSAGLKVGSTLAIGGMKLSVSGVISTSNVILSNAIMMPLQTAQSAQGYQGLVSAILVTPKAGEAGNVTQAIDAAIPGVTAVDPAESERLASTLLSSVGAINASVAAFGAGLAVLFVTIISSVNIFEKKDEFGTMWAIGSSTASVLKVALAETGLIAGAGYVLGLVLSVFATASVFQIFASVPASASISDIFTLIPIATLAFAGVVVVGFGLLVGAVSTWSLPKEMD